MIRNGMGTAKDSPSTPALEATSGWHTLDPDAPELIAARCTACGSYRFPPGVSRCPNPACGADALEPAPMSRRGALWSYTTNHYPPPPPYRAPEPFAPYTIAAVRLAREGMVVLGQLAEGVDVSSLAVGCEMELALGALCDGEREERLVWRWRPAAGR